VSLSGDTFFYANPLASDGKWKFNVNVAATRSPWFDCSCCPTNIVRLVPSLPGYIYAHAGETLYVNHFVAGNAVIELENGKVTLQQESNYPWDGTIKITVNPETKTNFALAIRIPGWAQNQPLPSDLYHYADSMIEKPSINVNGEAIEIFSQKGYVHIKRPWKAGDVVELKLPMLIRRVVSHEWVKENADRVAVERGPVVYCAEAVDNHGKAMELKLSDDEALEASLEPTLLGGVTVIKSQNLTLIPYYAWSHRGEGEMAVWLKRR
jgi:DUF1680 family protein